MCYLHGEGVLDKLLNDMIKEIKYSSEVTETKFNKPVLKYSTKCWICKKTWISQGESKTSWSRHWKYQG